MKREREREEQVRFLTERMVIGKVLAPALLLPPQSGHGGVDERLDGVIQPQLLRQS